MIEEGFINQIASELSVPAEKVSVVIHLLSGGATVPFVTHYRKDATGNLGEDQIEAIADRHAQYQSLLGRRGNILSELEKQALLTDELRARIEACTSRTQLEDLYLPFKSKRRTKATMAEEQGLAPLADFMLRQLPGLPNIEEFVNAFVKPDRSISSPEEAIEGACYIMAERFALDPDIRGTVRDRMLDTGKITARPTKNAEGVKTKFESYYGFSEPIAKIPSHRLLALLRGVKEGILRMDLTLDDEALFNDLVAMKVKEPMFESIIKVALDEAYTRHLRPALENEVMDLLHKRADEDAVYVFRQNALNILMAPAAGPMPIIGVTFSPRKGCKLAVVDACGNFIEHQTMFLPDSQEDEAETTAVAESLLLALMEKHQAWAVVVASNGTGTKEVLRFIKGVLAKAGKHNAFAMALNAGPASDYAASREGRQEFEDIESPLREAISVARMVQDPLSELVKVEPRSIGVGQYQHDINQKLLRDGLHRTVASCVNQVRVDINRGSVDLLRYVSGLQAGAAQNLVDQRTKKRRIESREELKEIGGFSEKVFEQCAGFLRVPGGQNPLDATAIHPEAYPVVQQIADSVQMPVSALIGNRDAIEKIDFNQFRTELIGPYTLSDIKQELLAPGRDVRSKFRQPKTIQGVTSLDALQEGMEVEGVVTNVTDFGAFVDIGTQQDGLVHLSELSNRFVKDPREVVKVGDIVKVKVIKVDKQIPRISLSMKAIKVEPRRPPRQDAQQGRGERNERPAGQGQQGADGQKPVGPRRERRPALAGAPRDEAAPTAAPGATDEQRRERRPDPRRGGTEQRREGEEHRPRAPRPDNRQQRDQAGSSERRSERPRRPQSPDRGPRKPLTHADEGGHLNTLLADQLAALKQKLGQ